MWQGESLSQSGMKRKRFPDASGETVEIGGEASQQPSHVQEALRRSFLSALMEQEGGQFTASTVQRSNRNSFSGVQTIQPMQHAQTEPTPNARVVVNPSSFPLQASTVHQQNLSGLNLPQSNIMGNINASLGNIDPQNNFAGLSLQGNTIAGSINPSLGNINQQELLRRAAELQMALNNPLLNMAQVLQMAGISATAFQQVVPRSPMHASTSNPPLPGTATTYASPPTYHEATAAGNNPAVPQELPKRKKASLISFPSPNDIVLGRGKKYRQHPGNMRMHMIVDLHRDAYLKASSREAKTRIKAGIINHIKNESGDKNGRFIKLDDRTNEWVEVDDAEALAKIGHAIRDGRSSENPLAAAGLEASRTIEPLTGNLKRGGEESSNGAEDETKILSDKEKEAARLLAGVFSSTSSSSSAPTDDSDDSSTKTRPERMSTSGSSSLGVPSE